MVASLRNVDSLGRISIPIELRRELMLDVHSNIEFFTDDNGNVVLRKYHDHCDFCGGNRIVMTFKGKMLCEICVGKMGSLNE